MAGIRTESNTTSRLLSEHFTTATGFWVRQMVKFTISTILSEFGIQFYSYVDIYPDELYTENMMEFGPKLKYSLFPLSDSAM
jgi:hypothetical protein